MYNNIINIMKTSDIEFDFGLNDKEIREIQNTYNVILPGSLKSFYKIGLPVSKGFYNWRDNSPENIEYIKHTMNKPVAEILEFSNQVEWQESWGKEPVDTNSRKDKIRSLAENAPKLIPVFSHRYIVSGQEEIKPVLSVCGTDIIYYGKNLIDYLHIEFNHEARGFKICDIEHIPFWSDII